MGDPDSEDDYAFYGSGLPQIDEDNIPRKKAFTVEDQIATDRNGRRRFHGAFTGGFSAGFFNTVGSLEGWTPTAFKSSRSSKSDSLSQKPEDFMDDEDREEFGIAPTVVRAKPEYGGNKGGKRERPQFHDGPIPGVPVLKVVLEPAKETIGVKLLMKMGWKPGQGVGPRLTKKEKKKAKIYGCAIPGHPQNNEDSDSDELEGADLDILFAPDDYESQCKNPKENTFGMGYKGLDRNPVLSSSGKVAVLGPGLKLQVKNSKLDIRGQAFGVGAFEEEDEDIYAKDDMSRYDFALESAATLKEKRREEKKMLKAITMKSNEKFLEGFIPAADSRPMNKSYPPPPLPRDFRPKPRISRFDQKGPIPDKTSNKLSALERREIIAEPEEKRIAAQEAMKAAEALIENVPGTILSFQPFETDLAKQDRFEKYMKFAKIGSKDSYKPIQPSSMTEWEKERERNEFEHALKLYVPLSGAMADRFTTAKASDDAQINSHELDVDPVVLKAAQAKMFGALTRKTHEWTPCQLMCKRFNIPVTKAETLENVAIKKKKSRFSLFDCLDAAERNAPLKVEKVEEVQIKEEIIDEEETGPPAPPESSPPEPAPSTTIISDPGDEVIELKESWSKMDLFRAIFLDSDDEAEKEPEAPPPEDLPVPRPAPETLNLLRNTSPPRGIFANLDLDAMKQPEPKEPSPEPEPDPLAYGPALPVKLETKPVFIKPIPASPSSSSSDDWVEKTDDDSESKKHKKTKKQKKDKKKDKHKHKKKKKHKK